MTEPEFNPYQSPAVSPFDLGESAMEGESRPSYKLHSIGSITLAAFLGSLAAGGVIMAINYRRLERPAAAIHSVVWTLVCTMVVLFVGTVLPDNFPGMVFLIPQIIGMYYVAKALQGELVEDHQRRGGAMASGWAAAGISILVAMVVVVVFFAVLMLLG